VQPAIEIVSGQTRNPSKEPARLSESLEPGRRKPARTVAAGPIAVPRWAVPEGERDNVCEKTESSVVGFNWTGLGGPAVLAVVSALSPQAPGDARRRFRRRGL